MTPSNQSVDVWVWSLDNPTFSDTQAIATLSPEETTRADRFRRPQDGTRFIAAHTQLRHILARYAGVSPEALTFAHTAHGKPRLANSAQPFHFNLSHTQAAAALAITTAAEVGIDIEVQRTIKEDIAAMFSDRERAAISTHPASDRTAALFRCWTRKEAVIKALGDGLSYDLKSFDVTVDANEPPRITRFDEAPAALTSWTLHQFEHATDIIGAVAVRAPSISLDLHHWSETLKN